jgi:hypothetical protein
MIWIAKAVVQKGISFLPFKTHINQFFQRRGTGAISLDDQHFGWKIGHAQDHLALWQKHYPNLDRSSANVLELGTGRYPIVPVYFWLHGVNSMDSLDLYPWISAEHCQTTAKKFVEWHSSGQLQPFLGRVDAERWSKLEQAAKSTMPLESFLSMIGLRTLVGDATSKIAGMHESYEFICSNNTLEHILEAPLIAILKHFKGLLSHGGGSSHFIDLSDHFGHFDRSITAYNFLKFSPLQWRLIDNDIQPQNRLRWVQYLDIFTKLGYRVVEAKVRPGSVDDLRKVKVHSSFAGLSEAELAITHGYVVAC